MNTSSADKNRYASSCLGGEVSIDVRNLVKKFGEHRAVDGLSFTAKPGQILGLLGPNGAGKSTTVKMLYGALAPDGGNIYYFGRDFTKHRRPVKLCIGVCGQSDTLDYDLMVRENLLLFATYYHMRSAEAHAKADALMGRFGLEGYANASPRVLSGGLRRRLQIARALINSPSILFLDEPTTGLDPHVRRELWDLLHELRLDGITILLTTHYMDEAEVLADNILVLDQGRLIEEGGPRDLIDKHFGPWVLHLRESEAASSRLAELGIQPRKGFGQFTVYADASTIETLYRDFCDEVVLRRRPNLEDLFLKLTGKVL